MQSKVQGKNILVSGKTDKKPHEVNYNQGIEEVQYEHACINIAQMTSKYKGITKQGY